MTFQEFQQQVLTLDIFSEETTVFNDRTSTWGGISYEAQDGFNGCVFNCCDFQVLINGANSLDESLYRANIQDAYAIAKQRAAAWQMINGVWTDTWNLEAVGE